MDPWEQMSVKFYSLKNTFQLDAVDALYSMTA